MKHSLLASLVLTGIFSTFSANANLINNASFESSPVVDSYAYTDWNVLAQSWDVVKASGKGYSWAVFSIIPGWQAFYGSGIELHASGTLETTLKNPVNAVDGDTYVELDTHFALDQPGFSNSGIFQLVSGLMTGAYYDLSFWYRARTTLENDNILNVYWSDPATTLTQGNYAARYDYSAAQNNHENWVQYTLRLQATGSSMLLGFGGDGNASWSRAETINGNGKGAAIDSLNLAVVPTPATTLLFCLGLAALAVARRKQN